MLKKSWEGRRVAKHGQKRKPYKDRIYTEDEAYTAMFDCLANKPVSQPGGPDLHPLLDPATYQAVQKAEADLDAEQLQSAIEALGEVVSTLFQQVQHLTEVIALHSETFDRLLKVPDQPERSERPERST